jgi:aryl-alcohol dehydrogenase-like predicted oxidoreductase
MDYTQLGSAGIRVSRLCLGGLNFGGVTNEAESVAVVHAALDSGINFVSTSNIYNDGASERIVGTAVRGRRNDVVIATMAGLRVGAGQNDHGNSRRHLVAQCEESLRRLGVDWIDLYQLHRPDPATPIEETLLALDDLIQAGKVRYVGTSTFPAWQVMEAMAVADRHGLRARPVTEQPPYHLLDRSVERELMPLARRYNLAVLPWSPIAAGILTGKYRAREVPEGTRFALSGVRERAESPSFRTAVEAASRLERLAADAGLTLMEFAVAWLLAQPGVTSAVIGPRDREQLTGYLDALDVSLDGCEPTAVDAVCPPGDAVYRL